MIRKVVVVICATVLPSTALSLVGVYYSERKKRRGEKGLPSKKEPWGRNSHSTGKRRRECACV